MDKNLDAQPPSDVQQQIDALRADVDEVKAKLAAMKGVL